MNKKVREEVLSLLNMAYYFEESDSNYKSRINSIYEQLTLTDVGKHSELLLGFLQKLRETGALKHTESWQLKTYVANYLKDK